MNKRKRVPAAASDISIEGLWMIPYADLMTLMMLLFLALFAMAIGKKSSLGATLTAAKIAEQLASKENAREAGKNVREAELASEIEQALKGLALKDFGIRVTTRYIHLTLPSPVLFRTGSAKLSKRATKVLVPLARILGRTKNPILISGHTDNVPISRGPYKTNWELSAARSFAVIRWFAGRKLEPKRFSARGYGEFRPVAPNKTPAGRLANRRIEISIVREGKKEG